MSRTRIVLTLLLVATLSMLAGLAATTFAARRLSPHHESRPEATEPQRTVPASSHIVVNA